MELSPARFLTVEGTTITLHCRSREDAIAALDELQHKRKELALMRREIQKQQRNLRSDFTETTRNMSSFSLLGVFSRPLGRAGTLGRSVNRINLAADLAPGEQKLREIEELQLNVDKAILHIQNELRSRG